MSLAFSLHAPTQELRQTIVPSASAYPLPKLMQAFDTFLDKQEHRNPKVPLCHTLRFVNSAPGLRERQACIRYLPTSARMLRLHRACGSCRNGGEPACTEEHAMASPSLRPWNLPCPPTPSSQPDLTVQTHACRYSWSM